MDEERALGVRNTLLWYLTDSQDILFLLGSPFQQWKINWILSNKEDAAAATTVDAETMAVAKVDLAAGKQAAAGKTPDKETEIKAKEDAAVAKMATTIEQYATALAAAGRAAACARVSAGQVCPKELKKYINEVKWTGMKAGDAIQAAGELGRTTKKAQCPSLPPSVYSEHASIRSRRQDPGVGLVARILRTRRPHSPPRHDVLRSTDVLQSTDRARQGPRFALPGPGYFKEGQPATLHLGASRLKESTQLELDLQVACAKRHRSTAQGTGHH